MTARPHNMGFCKPDCFGCKAGSVMVSSRAMPTRRGSTIQGLELERKHATDIAAYKRLRHEGYQPKATKGAARLEATAVSNYEIETGKDLKGDAKAGKRYDEVNAAYKAGKLADVV